MYNVSDAGFAATDAELAEGDLYAERVHQLVTRFPFYGEARAESIARTEIELLRALRCDDY